MVRARPKKKTIRKLYEYRYIHATGERSIVVWDIHYQSNTMFYCVNSRGLSRQFNIMELNKSVFLNENSAFDHLDAEEAFQTTSELVIGM